MTIQSESFTVQLAAAGQHNGLNAWAAAACCSAIGISAAKIAEGLQAFAPVSGRLQLKQAAAGARLIDDTYNANPDSVKAAIDEAMICKEEGKEKCIIIAFSGHGHFDLAAYDAYHRGKLEDFAYPEEKINEALAEVPQIDC